MAIPIEREDVSELEKWCMGLEKLVELCEFCRRPTRYWHTRTNNPVCPDCAKSHRMAELRNRRKGAHR